MLRAWLSNRGASTEPRQRTNMLGRFGAGLKSRGEKRAELSNTEFEKQLQDLASILMNMVIIGKEKRRTCKHYNAINGICKQIKIEVQIPTLLLTPDGDGYRVVVSMHPEVCIACPFWEKAKDL